MKASRNTQYVQLSLHTGANLRRHAIARVTLATCPCRLISIYFRPADVCRPDVDIGSKACAYVSRVGQTARTLFPSQLRCNMCMDWLERRSQIVAPRSANSIKQTPPPHRVASLPSATDPSSPRRHRRGPNRAESTIQREQCNSHQTPTPNCACHSTRGGTVSSQLANRASIRAILAPIAG